MKHNAQIMRQARLEAIRILDNPKCTEGDFKHVRPLLNDNTIKVRALDLRPLICEDKLGGLQVYVYHCLNKETGYSYVGTISDIASQMGVTYNRLYNTMSDTQPTTLDIEFYPIDVIPSYYNKVSVIVFDDKNHVMFDGSYGTVCKLLNIHTSDLWELIENNQHYKHFRFEVGGMHV